MIKNKKAIYILLPIVIVIWGLIINKVFRAVHNADNNIAYVSNEINFFSSDSSVVDTFAISDDYRDPFLGKPHSDEKPIKKIIESAKARPHMEWPTVCYTGMVKNTQNDQQLVMVRINGTNQFMRLGDKVSGIELTKVYRDSIELKFLMEKKIFLK